MNNIIFKMELNIKMLHSSSHRASHRTSYRDERDFCQRKHLSDALMQQYPNCIPVIVERSVIEIDLPIIDKRQYLVPHTMNVGNFLFMIRRRLGIASWVGIWIYTGKYPLSVASIPLIEIYNNYRDPDGFLYIQYRGEDRFGSYDLKQKDKFPEYEDTTKKIY